MRFSNSVIGPARFRVATGPRCVGLFLPLRLGLRQRREVDAVLLQNGLDLLQRRYVCPTSRGASFEPLALQVIAQPLPRDREESRQLPRRQARRVKSP